MADVKWFKITTDMFNDEKLRLIDALPERDTIHYVWMRLLSQAGRCNANGKIFLNENMSYSEEMLSMLFNRPIDLIRVALNTLCKFSMISIEEDNTILIINWDKHQNVEGLDRIREQTKKRVSNHRNKQNSDNKQVEEEEKTSVEECNVTEKTCNVTEKECNVTVTQQNKKENKNKNKNKKKEIEKDKDKDKEIEQDKDKEIEIESLGSLEDRLKAEKIRGDTLSMLLYYDKLIGILGVLNIAIVKHGDEKAGKAIDKSLEANKVYDFKGFKSMKSRGLIDKEIGSLESRII